MSQATGSVVETESRPCRSVPFAKGSVEWQAWDRQLSDDDVARVVVAALPDLDLRPLWKSYSGRGSLPYSPELLLAMVLVEKPRGRASPSQWPRDQRDSIALQWIGQGIPPARSVWSEFRDRRAPFLDGWNEQVLRRAIANGLRDGSQAATDGTLIAACASRQRLVNQSQITSRWEQLDAACAPDLRQEPVAKKSSWMAGTPAGREQQRARSLRAQELLQPRLAANARQCPSERLPEKRVVISVSDPEAALGLDKFKVFRPLYDTLLLIDRHRPLILGEDVFAQSPDTSRLVPILERTRPLTGRLPQCVAADAGFLTALNLAHRPALGVDLIGPWKENDFSERHRKPAKQSTTDQFVWPPDEHAYECPAGQRWPRIGRETRTRAGDQVEHLERFRAEASGCSACSLRTACTTSRDGRQLRRSEYEDVIQAHRAKMATPTAKAILKTRGQVAERGFADLKEHRQLRRHTGRSLTRAKTDVGLAVLIHNLLTLEKYLARTSQSPGASP